MWEVEQVRWPLSHWRQEHTRGDRELHSRTGSFHGYRRRRTRRDVVEAPITASDAVRHMRVLANRAASLSRMRARAGNVSERAHGPRDRPAYGIRAGSRVVGLQ